MIRSREIRNTIQGACDFSCSYGQHAYQEPHLLFQYFLSYKDGEPFHFFQFGLNENGRLFPFDLEETPPIRVIGRKLETERSNTDWFTSSIGEIEPIALELNRKEGEKTVSRAGLNLKVSFRLWSIKAMLQLPWGSIEITLPDSSGRRRSGVPPVKARWSYTPSFQEFACVEDLGTYLRHMLRPKSCA